MTAYLFPDNTVLCNFAAVDRLDLLRTVLNGRGRWTEAVAYEAERSARYQPPLEALPSDGWLGDPIEIDAEADVLRINAIRRAVFGGSDDEPLRHLGEAQTCYLIQHCTEFSGSWWISDDREALRYARRQGIVTRETIDLVKIAVVDGDIPELDAFALMKDMSDKGRSLRLPASPAEFWR
jgi:hypothetical protein